MGKLASVKYKNLEFVLRKSGFAFQRQKGSHAIWSHPDSRSVVITIHKGKTIKIGLLHKIITSDLKMTIDEFFKILRG
jgi:predicted RNA binding protein YcfA (HicA-like mRNA interferase family)